MNLVALLGSPKVHEIRHQEIINKVMSYSKNKIMSVLEMKVPSPGELYQRLKLLSGWLKMVIM